MEQTEENLLLNETEVSFLNKTFEVTHKDFDFTNKKIAFIMISGESGKTAYFDMHKKHAINANHPCQNGNLYIFTDGQKIESGGYDGAILYWSKFLFPTERVIKMIKKRRLIRVSKSKKATITL